MTTNELIAIVDKITRENIDNVVKKVSKLSLNQIEWRPNKGVWNIREVLAHLNSYATYYHPAFAKKIASTRHTSSKEAFLSSPLGRSAWKSMQLGRLNNIKRKFKSPKSHNPSFDNELVSGKEIDVFIDQQKELLQICEKAKEVNIRKVKIPISISKIVRLRLGDALLFVAYHNQRHMQQINNLMNHANFPKKQ